MANQSSLESLVDSAVSNGMALIQHLSTEELKLLINNDEKFDDLIKDLPQVKSLKTEREMLLAQNKSLAEWNLSQEPKLRQAKEKLMETYEQAAVLKEEAETKKKELDSMADKRSLDTTLALLQAAAQEAEDESEVRDCKVASDKNAIAEQFIGGNLHVEEFWTQFEPKRSLAHSRRLKAEKLNEVLRSQRYGGGGAGGIEGRLPYPVVPVHQAPPVPSRGKYPIPGWNPTGYGTA